MLGRSVASTRQDFTLPTRSEDYHHLRFGFIWWYLTRKDSDIVAAFAKAHMDGEDGEWTRRGAAQQEQRWQVDAICCTRALNLLDAVSSKGTAFFPDFPLAMASRTDGYKSTMWKEFAEMGLVAWAG